MAHARMSTLHFCLLAAVLSLLVYYLTNNSTCSSVKDTRLGTRLHVTPSRLHILVTGGAGFIGSHAVQALLKDGHAVTVVDNLSRGSAGAVRVLQRLAPPGQFQFIQADLGVGHDVIRIFLDSHFDVVMHFAAIAYVGESMQEPLRYYHNITANVVNVLEAMKAANVKRLVFSSTCATYGNPTSLPVTEETPTWPINPYGRAKLMAEQVIRDYASADRTLEVVIFRYFNVYGSDPEGYLGEYPLPSLRSNHRISNACMDAALKQRPSLTIQGTSHPTRDGTCIRDYIHVADLVHAHILGIHHLANPPALYNVGTGKGVSVREFVDACQKVTGQDIAVLEQVQSRAGDYAEIWADPAKIMTEMGWSARYDLETSLAHSWAWRQRHPLGYT